MTGQGTELGGRLHRSPVRFRVAAGMLVAVLVLAGCGDDDADQAADPSAGMSAAFAGDACVYSGPTEVEVGDEFEITVTDVTEERADVGFAVLKVHDGTTVSEIHEKGLSEFVNEAADEAAVLLFSAVTEEGTERILSGTLDVAGTWVLNCFDLSVPANPEGDDFPATTLEVVERS